MPPADDLMNTYGDFSLELVSGEGAWLIDAEGHRYLDLLAGIAVASLGQGHTAIIEAVTEQIRHLTHTSNFFTHRPELDVARLLIDRFGQNDAKVFFCNSGTEANEAALKLSRLTGKKRILAAVSGFHGRTMGALSLTGQPDKRAAFEPLVPGVEFYPYGDARYLRALIEVNPADTAAIILEPIQGETGVIPAPAGFLRAVRELCDEFGLLMIVDEVQTGVGRTGTFFAHSDDGVVPDVVTMAKGLAGGLPIGAVLARGQAATLFTPGSHGTTFGGNPVSCAAARAVLSTIDSDFCHRIRVKGQRFIDGLSSHRVVSAVRGRGLMLGVVLTHACAKQAVKSGLSHGVILNATSEDVVRLTPPLVISDEDIDEAITRLWAVFDDVDEGITKRSAPAV